MPEELHCNKIVVDGETRLDLTEDTVSPEALLFGATAHDASGAPIVGSLSIITTHNDLSGRSAPDTHPLSAITGLSDALEDKYELPSDGIPESDLASAVQALLDKADTAVQPVVGKGLSTNDYTNEEKDKLSGLENYDDTGILEDIEEINSKIPSAASPTDKLVSQSEMGDAISSVEAKQLYKTTLQGSFETRAELVSATTFYNADGTIAVPTKNDVAYVLSDETREGKSAKYVIAAVSEGIITWGFVIAFSDTVFTQAQMSSINSGMTANLRETYSNHVSNSEVHVTLENKSSWNSKQDTISDLSTIRSGAALGATAVQPEAGKGLFSGDYNDLANKPDIPSDLSDLADDATHRLVTDAEKSVWNSKQDNIGYTTENVANKVTSISSASTDTEYPSAKAVYDYILSLDGNGVSY